MLKAWFSCIGNNRQLQGKELMSTYVNLCQLMSTYVNLCQLMSTYVNLCQLMSLRHNTRQSNKYPRQLLSLEVE